MRTIIFIVSIAFTTAFFCQNTSASSKDDVRIVILTSHNTNEYIQAREGIEDFLSGKDIQLKTLSLSLQGKTLDTSGTVQQIKDHKPTLIICLGSLAANIVIIMITK